MSGVSRIELPWGQWAQWEDLFYVGSLWLPLACGWWCSWYIFLQLFLPFLCLSLGPNSSSSLGHSAELGHIILALSWLGHLQRLSNQIKLYFQALGGLWTSYPAGRCNLTHKRLQAQICNYTKWIGRRRVESQDILGLRDNLVIYYFCDL